MFYQLADVMCHICFFEIWTKSDTVLWLNSFYKKVDTNKIHNEMLNMLGNTVPSTQWFALLLHLSERIVLIKNNELFFFLSLKDNCCIHLGQFFYFVFLIKIWYTCQCVKPYLNSSSTHSFPSVSTLFITFFLIMSRCDVLFWKNQYS